MNPPLIAFGWPNGADMLIIAILVLVLFGSHKLPTFFQSLGRSMGEFRRAKEELEERARNTLRREPEPEAGQSLTPYWLTLLMAISLLMMALAHKAGH
jgi:sec-independent protein translocase protein TatA